MVSARPGGLVRLVSVRDVPVRLPPLPSSRFPLPAPTLRDPYLYYNIVHMTGTSLGDFELTVLLAVARLGDDAYGVRIRRDVNAMQRHEYAVGAIYTTLGRLETKRFVESTMSDPLPIRGGRSRRNYRVTAAGQRAIREARDHAARVWGTKDLGPSRA